MKQIWERIDAWVAANAPEVVAQQRPGASEADLAKAEKELGFKLPADLRASFSIHDGGGSGLFSGPELVTLEESLQQWGAMRELGFGKSEDMPNVGEPMGPVKPVWWSESWLPILLHADGDMLCADMDPAEGGSAGQLVEFVSKDPTRMVVASSWRELLGQLADDLDDGLYHYDDDWGWLVRGSEEEEAFPDEVDEEIEEDAKELEGEAARILDMLIGSEAVELEASGAVGLVPKLARILALSPDPVGRANAVNELLLDSEFVAEVFVSEEQLETFFKRW